MYRSHKKTVKNQSRFTLMSNCFDLQFDILQFEETPCESSSKHKLSFKAAFES